MRTTGKQIEKAIFGRQLYFGVAIMAAFPIWLMVNGYFKSIGVHKNALAAIAVTALFITGIFTGRYIARLWSLENRRVQNTVVAIMLVLIIGCTSWLFFHADFPLRNRVAINLMLFSLPFIAIGLATGIVVKLVRAVNQRLLDEARMATAHSKSELYLLQSQLSPHFLFNTLNNLYGLSLTQHEKVPALLLKLSELLRYTVYEATEAFVLLKDEVAYIQHYIEFEKIRLGNRLRLQLHLEETPGEARMAPMLLIVFIENAFKHSKNSADETIFIEITLKAWGDSLLFSVKNSQQRRVTTDSMPVKHSGFGLANVRKRLELLYPLEHELTILDEETSYNVLLQLKIK